MKLNRYLLNCVFFLIAVLSSCEEKEEIIELKNLIQLEIEDYDNLLHKGELKADGKKKIKIIATIHKNAAEANRVVKFVSSAGTFDVADANKQEAKVYATLLNENDSMLTASTYLTLGTTSGQYVISAIIDNKPLYKVEKVFPVLPLSNINTITQFIIEDYEELNGKVKADGLTKVKLIAYVPKNATEDNRVVEFNTSAGTFDTAEDSKSKKEVVATLQNETDTVFTATTYLTLPFRFSKSSISSCIKFSVVLNGKTSSTCSSL